MVLHPLSVPLAVHKDHTVIIVNTLCLQVVGPFVLDLLHPLNRDSIYAASPWSDR